MASVRGVGAPGGSNQSSTGYPETATFKDVVGPVVTRQVMERQRESERRAAEWRRQGSMTGVSGQPTPA
jgi:hypothetical protein